MSKPMTAAEYRRNAEQRRAFLPTEIVTLKSGSVFELRRPDLQTWIMTGRVPQTLVEAGVAAWKAQGKASTDGKQPDPKIVTDAAIFFLDLVQSCTVSPRYVEFPDPEKNEIGPGTMLDEDFYEIVGWAMNHQGVAGIEGLQTFREGRERGTAGDSADGAEQRSQTLESVAD